MFQPMLPAQEGPGSQRRHGRRGASSLSRGVRVSECHAGRHQEWERSNGKREADFSSPELAPLFFVAYLGFPLFLFLP